MARLTVYEDEQGNTLYKEWTLGEGEHMLLRLVKGGRLHAWADGPPDFQTVCGIEVEQPEDVVIGHYGMVDCQGCGAEVWQ